MSHTITSWPVKILSCSVAVQTFGTSTAGHNLCIKDRTSELPVKYIFLSAESVSEQVNVKKDPEINYSLGTGQGYDNPMEMRWAQLSVPKCSQ